MKAIERNTEFIDIPTAIIADISAAAMTMPSESIMLSEAIVRAMCVSGVRFCIIAYIGML